MNTESEISQLLESITRYNEINSKLIDIDKKITFSLVKRGSLIQDKKDLMEKLAKEIEIKPLPNVLNILSEIQVTNQSIMNAENDKIIHCSQYYSLLREASELKLIELILDENSTNDHKKNIEKINNAVKDIKISIDKNLKIIRNEMTNMYFTV
jgi:hypothetical protein